MEFINIASNQAWQSLWIELNKDYKICIYIAIYAGILLDFLNIYWYYRFILIIKKALSKKIS